jgi:hypothetical protein
MATSETDRRTASTDRGAVLALVLAFLLPPVGALIAIYGRGEGKLSGLRVAAVAIGAIGTVLGTLLGVMALGLANSPS